MIVDGIFAAEYVIVAEPVPGPVKEMVSETSAEVAFASVNVKLATPSALVKA